MVNKLRADALFLTTQGSNGVCNAWYLLPLTLLEVYSYCHISTAGTRSILYLFTPLCGIRCEEGPKFPDPKPYGVNAYGVSMKFTITTFTGQYTLSMCERC